MEGALTADFAKTLLRKTVSTAVLVIGKYRIWNWQIVFLLQYNYKNLIIIDLTGIGHGLPTKDFPSKMVFWNGFVKCDWPTINRTSRASFHISLRIAFLHNKSVWDTGAIKKNVCDLGRFHWTRLQLSQLSCSLQMTNDNGSQIEVRRGNGVEIVFGRWLESSSSRTATESKQYFLKTVGLGKRVDIRVWRI